MSVAVVVTLIVQIILSLILIVVVLFQSGSQAGLSGSIAGGAETFFGKNKGRTMDAKLKKWTSVVAILFLVCSIVLSFLVSKSQTAAPDNSGMSIPLEQTIPEDGTVSEGEVPSVELLPAEGEEPSVELIPAEEAPSAEAVPAE